MAELQSFPTKPRLKPTSKKPNNSPESKYWKSFKTTEISGLVSSITSIDFSPLSPHHFAATYGASLSYFNPHHPFSPSEPLSTIHSFKDISFSASFRSDGKLIAAGCQSGTVHVFEAKTRNQLRQLKGHCRPVRLVKYPIIDRLHLFTAADDSIVKYWDVATETSLIDFLGHKDYVRSGSVSPIDDNVFVSGSYDHTVRVWDVRGGGGSNSGSAAMVVNHGKPVEDVMFLPSGGLIATAGGNVVKIWDVIGGGKCVYSMESHNKTVTSMCIGKMGKDSGEESHQYRLLSVSLDGYLKVFDYSRLKITFSMRFPAPLVSVGFSPDCSSRVIGTSNGIIYMSKRNKEKVEEERTDGRFLGFQYRDEQQKRVLKPSYFRYFHRGQSEKPRGGEYLVLRSKKVKLAEHDKLLRKFRHKDALVAVLQRKNPENVVAVMEELVARKKLFKCVSNLDIEELELLLVFLQKYTTFPRFAGFLMPFASKVIQMRVDDIRASDGLKVQIRNLKRSITEELRIQQSLLAGNNFSFDENCWEEIIRIVAVQALTTLAIRSGEPYRIQIYEFLNALAHGGVQAKYSDLHVSNGEDQGASGTGLGSLLSPMIQVLDEMYKAQDDLIRDIRTHDNANKEWTDEELKKLYETHEKLLDLVSLFCYVPRAKYLPLGPTSVKLIEIYRNKHNITPSTGFAGFSSLSDPAVATGISDLMYETKTTPDETDGLDDDLVNAWAANLGDDGLLGKNAPAMSRVNEFLAGMGTDAPDVEEENVIARPSVGYDDMWAKTLLESTELEEDDVRSGSSSPDSAGSVGTSISSHVGGMNYPSLFSSKPSYGGSQTSEKASNKYSMGGSSSFYEGYGSPIREEPPSYESHAFERADSFANPLAGPGSHSVGSQDEERVSFGPRPGTALYDFTAGGDDELNLTAGEDVEIEYEVDGWFYVKNL